MNVAWPGWERKHELILNQRTAVIKEKNDCETEKGLSQKVVHEKSQETDTSCAFTAHSTTKAPSRCQLTVSSAIVM